MLTWKGLVGIAAIAGVTACGDMQLGGGNSLISGSAGSGDSRVADASGGGTQQLMHCAQPLGTLALVESQIPALTQVGLTSPVPVIRLLAAQSHCFNVIERGQALTRMTEERDLASQGLLRSGSNVGRGQMIAADYMVTPNVVFSEDNAGGWSSAIGSFIPTYGAVLSHAMGSLKFKEAQAVLALTDTRSGMQTAVAEGRARSTDIGGGLGLGSLGGFGGLGGYGNTNEGKVVAAAFLDAFNKLVEQVRATTPTG